MARYTVERLLESLKSEDTSIVQNALRYIQFEPTGNADIREAIMNLFSDKRITILYVKPMITYGDLAYIAGETLTFEYAKAGIEDNVTIVDTISPLTAGELINIANNEEYEEASKVTNINDRYQTMMRILDEKGKLQRRPMLFVTIRARLYLQRKGKI